MVNGIDVRTLFTVGPRERFQAGVSERIAAARRGRSREPIVFRRGQATRAETTRRARVTQLLAQVGGDIAALPEAERIEVQRIRAGVTPRVERREIIRRGEDPFSRQRRILDERRSNLERIIASRESEAQRLATKQRSLESESQRLERLSTAGQLQFGVAQKFRAEVRAFEKEISQFNQAQTQTEQRVEQFEESRQSLNRQQQAAVARGEAPRDGEIRGLPRGEIRAAGPPSLIPEIIGEPLRGIERGIATGGESAFAAAFEAGQLVARVTPEPVAQLVRGGLRASPAAVALFGGALTGEITPREARERIVPLGGLFTEAATLAIPGPVGVARRLQAFGAFGRPEDLLIGGAFGVAGGFARTGSQFAKLALGTGRIGTVLRTGEQAVAKGITPVFLGFTAITTGAAIREATIADRPEEVRRISQEFAGSLGGFILGERIGARIGTQFLGPAEASLARETALRQLKPGEQARFRKFFEIAREFEKVKGKPRELDLRTQRLTSKESKIVQRILREDSELVLFGSASIAPQVPKKVARTLKRPEDIDISSANPSQAANKILRQLEATGTKRLSAIRKGGGVVITKGGVKVLEVKPRERLLASIETVRGPFELPSQSFVTTPSGIRLFRLSTQAKRQAIGGALEQPGIRQKDIERLERLSAVLTPEQVTAARARARRAPLPERLRQEFGVFLGEQRGELFPGRQRLLFPSPEEFIGVAPRGAARRRAGLLFGGERPSRLPELPRTAFFALAPSRLPRPTRPSRLPPVTPSDLPRLFVTGPSALPFARPQDFIFPSALPTPTRPSRLPSLSIQGFPPITTTQTFSFLAPPTPPSRLPPIVPSRLPTPFFPPTRPSRLLPPTRPPRVPPVVGGPVFFGGDLLGAAPVEKVQGYNAFVKSKPFKKKKFKKVTRRPIPRANALQRGFFVADNTIAQSVKIKKAKKLVRPVPPPLFSLAAKFAFKPKTNVHIERRGAAIDTPGEVQGLKVGKFLAQERRGFFGGFGLRPSPRRKRRKRRKK